MALTKFVDLVISPDTGVLHASGCYDTPKIGLLGHTTIENITKYFKNDYSIYIADRKMGLFKKAQPEVLLLNKNPFTETIQMSNVVIVVEKPFYKKNLFWAGAGLIGGFLLSK
jgi:ADP-heptose:LPS heptosyltransferase